MSLRVIKVFGNTKYLLNVNAKVLNALNNHVTTLLPLHPESSNMDLVNWC